MERGLRGRLAGNPGLFLRYFSLLLSLAEVLNIVAARLTVRESEALDALFTADEVKGAVFESSPKIGRAHV